MISIKVLDLPTLEKLRNVLKQKFAKIAQLVERHLAKVEVAGSNPVFRSASIHFSTFGLKKHSATLKRLMNLKSNNTYQ